MVLRQRNVWLLFTLFILLYIGMAVGLAPDPRTLQHYHISTAVDRLINFVIVLPVVAIAYITLYGYSRLKRYAVSIRKAPEGKGLFYVATGLGYLAFSIPVTAIISNWTDRTVRHSPNLLPTGVIINNYISLGFLLVGFIFIAYGARSIYSYIKKPAHITTIHLLALGVLFLGVTYAFVVMKSPYRQIAEPVSGRAIYYLPDWLILVTIILPYVFTWYLGVMSGFYIYLYSKHVKGVIYKHALQYVAVGLEGIIAAYILVRYISAVANSLIHLSLAPLLLLIYILLIIISIGFILIALGARRLQKIEEV